MMCLDINTVFILLLHLPPPLSLLKVLSVLLLIVEYVLRYLHPLRDALGLVLLGDVAAQDVPHTSVIGAAVAVRVEGVSSSSYVGYDPPEKCRIYQGMLYWHMFQFFVHSHHYGCHNNHVQV